MAKEKFIGGNWTLYDPNGANWRLDTYRLTAGDGTGNGHQRRTPQNGLLHNSKSLSLGEGWDFTFKYHTMSAGGGSYDNICIGWLDGTSGIVVNNGIVFRPWERFPNGLMGWFFLWEAPGTVLDQSLMFLPDTDYWIRFWRPAGADIVYAEIYTDEAMTQVYDTLVGTMTSRAYSHLWCGIAFGDNGIGRRTEGQYIEDLDIGDDLPIQETRHTMKLDAARREARLDRARRVMQPDRKGGSL